MREWHECTPFQVVFKYLLNGTVHEGILEFHGERTTEEALAEAEAHMYELDPDFDGVLLSAKRVPMVKLAADR